jgi:hypothetical protein
MQVKSKMDEGTLREILSELRQLSKQATEDGDGGDKCRSKDNPHDR